MQHNPEDPRPSGTDQNIHAFFTDLLRQRDAQIKQLQDRNEELRKSGMEKSDWEKRFENLHEEHETLKREFQVEINGYKSRINGLNGIIAKLRDDIADKKPDQQVVGDLSRKWEWGLAFFSLLFGAALGIWGGMKIQKRIGAPKPLQTRAFEAIQEKHQFNFEYAIANGRFAGLDSVLRSEMALEANASIKPELEFMQQILKATRRKLEQHNIPTSDAGYALLPDNEIHATAKYKGSLTVTEPTLTVRAEASANSEKLGALKKDDQVKIIDRSHRIDKISTRYEGKRAEIEDVWYKIEMPNGMEGWVFGYYTSASRQQMIVFADEGGTATGTTVPAAKPAVADSVKVIAPAKKPGQQ